VVAFRGLNWFLRGLYMPSKRLLISASPNLYYRRRFCICAFTTATALGIGNADGTRQKGHRTDTV